ncbi:hypothetical protein HME9302_01608 [Alteripontixanthobacter maritimus]|uniref:Ancillary SecYEG translocon subunit/Cell division coordinator CpoB TPR domain-containing protein n=1 Tax=Alteripontixanthobacter maritimus TaxID=2161824 RepID=A0A369Q6A0_9SPHN|nr:tetratricopeptide repeat protein [Alteripontixanthobacter maritimus]RDC60401.1 hypothetical protein HME9302_01608 [Alteripontixanthobacter maritimus]
MALTPTNIPDQRKTAGPKEDFKAKQAKAQDEALLREVDDAYRKDRYGDFAKNYGKIVIAVLVLGLAAFAGYIWWSGQQEAAREAESEQIVAALDQVEAGNLDTAEQSLAKLGEEGGEGSRTVARMIQAGIALENGKSAEAAQIFQAVATDANAPQAYRDLALLRDVAARFENMKPADVVAQLAPITKPGNAYFGSAGELTATAYLEMGKPDEAGALLATIAKDQTVPDTLRSRARQLAGVLGVDAIEDVDALLEEQGVSADGPSAPAPASASAPAGQAN